LRAGTRPIAANRDLPVAQPLAVVERYVLGFIRMDSIGIMEYVGGASDLETFLTRDVAALPPGQRRRVKDRVIETVVRLLKAFHERGFVHRDMKAPNLMVCWHPPYTGMPVLTFIDMDGIKHVRRVRDSQSARAIVRLCASLLGSPACTASDRLRFLRSYLTGPGRSPADWKVHWRKIHEAVCSKLQDKEMRRQWKLAHYGRE
jgi:serine/threonine protein kinase